MNVNRSVLRRWLLRLSFLILLIASFAAGLKLRWHCVVVDTMGRLRNLDEKRRGLCQEIIGENYFHLHGVDEEGDAKLAVFDPAHGSNSLQLSYHNGLAGRSSYLILEGDGSLVSETESGKRKLGNIDPARCKMLFKKVLSSGLLNYSEAVIGLKERLDDKLGLPIPSTTVCDGSLVRIYISVPDLAVNKEIVIYEPEFALKNHPDIIEFQLFIFLEKEILSLVPENDPDWK